MNQPQIYLRILLFACPVIATAGCFSPAAAVDSRGDESSASGTDSTQQTPSSSVTGERDSDSVSSTGPIGTSSATEGDDASETTETTETTETGDATGCVDALECDDRNPCSQDLCTDGRCGHVVVTDDPSCSCDTVEDCTDLPPANTCRALLCDAGACTLALVEAGTDAGVELQTEGDCLQVVCDGLGGTEEVIASSDVPDDGLECTEDACDEGTPQHTAIEAGQACSAGECDGNGSCYGCSLPADCGGTPPCLIATCMDGLCDVDPIDADTPCADGVCDGAGNCVACNDASDCAPASACEVVSCVAHACVTESTNPGTECSDGLFCTGTDSCDGNGNCVGAGNPCPGADADNDCSETCNEAADACTGNDPVNSLCNDGLFCTGDDRCNGQGICVGGSDPCPGPDGDTNCAESCSEATDSCTGNDPANTDCGGVCNACTANGSCHVYGPGQCP